MTRPTFNSFSGGIGSTFLSLQTGKTVPNIMVNTGMNQPNSWRIMWELRKRRYKVIVLSSAQGGYATYYDYVMNEIDKKQPLITQCSDRGKQKHLNHFYNTLSRLFKEPINVNIGYLQGEENRALRFNDTRYINYKFPVIEYSREEAKESANIQGLYPEKTGCTICPYITGLK